ncbi:hypothetical protein DD237_008262 [Peronospora effusa]|uniref:CDP-alcohol phosphatidyltransferase n=1 Tax=Peronospora effusa TaxID=542832 RepID=A0A425C201_9STRA|nr:hypothetical protein DD237_008262 [Peronospora effusa]
MVGIKSEEIMYGSTTVNGSSEGIKRRNSLRSNSSTSSGDDEMETIKLAPTNSSNCSPPSVAKKATYESILERYLMATCTKMYDVEELIDYYWHRRLAAVPTVIVSYLPFVITPNQITIFGLFLGWGAALCLYDSEFHYPLSWEPSHSLLTAAFLMFTWIISDCTDGQVARLCKRGTRTGRILDGVVDFLSECDGETVASVRAEYRAALKQSACALDTILLGIYTAYLTIQASFTSDAASKAETNRQAVLGACTSEQHEAYRRRFSGLARIASFLGVSTHVTAVYLAYFLAIFHWDVIFYMQFYPIVLLNIVLVGVLIEYKRSGMATYTPS